MLFLMHWIASPEDRDETFERFRQKGHQLPPGVKIVKALFALHQHEGWLIIDADSPVEMSKWLYKWSDINDHEVFPVIDEAEFRSVIGA